MLAGRQVEGRDWWLDSRCRPRKRISQCSNFMHRRTMPLYEDRSGSFFAGWSDHLSVFPWLVGHDHILARSRSVSFDGQRDGLSLVSRDLRSGAEFYLAAAIGRCEHRGRYRRIDSYFSPRAGSVPELGRLQYHSERRPNARLPLRTQTRIPVPVAIIAAPESTNPTSAISLCQAPISAGPWVFSTAVSIP